MKSSSNYQTQAHASSPAVATPSGVPAFHGQKSGRVLSLPSHVPDAAARVIVAKSRPRCSSSNFRLQDPWPRINQAPKSKAQPPKETSKPRQKSKCDAFKKKATPMTPPSQDFYPWMKELEGTTMPPKKPSSRSSANKLGLHPTSTAVTVVPPLCTCSSEGLQRSVTPSDQTTHRAGHGSAACITSPYVESVEDH